MVKLGAACIRNTGDAPHTPPAPTPPPGRSAIDVNPSITALSAACPDGACFASEIVRKIG
jgi:hypothetical protein